MSLHSPPPGFPYDRRPHEEYSAPPAIAEGREELARATKDLMRGVEDHSWSAAAPHSIPPHILPPHFANHTAYSRQFQQVQLPPSHPYSQPHYYEPVPSVPSQPVPKRLSPKVPDSPRKKARVSSPFSSGSPEPSPTPVGSAQASSTTLDSPTKPTPGPSKVPATLLTPSQKKANHIQSEQKRRANIRRGYETLCIVVPALREAIEKGSDSASDDEDDQDKGKSKSKKARPRRRKGEGGKESRAGPKSEGIVLGKTIEYINALVNERNSLLQRLEYATDHLPSDFPRHPDPLWEKQWTGGTGTDPSLIDGGEEDEFEDS